MSNKDEIDEILNYAFRRHKLMLCCPVPVDLLFISDPDIDPEDVIKNKAKLDKERLKQTAEFQAAALKFKHLHIDWKLLGDQYLGFLYLVEPIYVDDQDHVREIIRDLFAIDKVAEQRVIDRLKSSGHIDVTGNVITVTDAKTAATGTAIIVKHMGADLEKIITLIQGA